MPRKRPLQLDDLFRLKALGRVAMSPNGERVAYELKRFDADENRNFTQLMLLEVATGATRPLTKGKQNDTMPKWSPDGLSLAFVSDREKPTCLFVLPMTGGDARRITDRDGAISDFAWSPDGRRIAFVRQPLTTRDKLERDGRDDELKKQPQFKHITRLFHKLDGAGWWNGEYAHVWLMNADGTRPRQVSFGDYDDREPRFSPDGRLVSFVSNRVPDPDCDPENADIYVVPTLGRGAKPTKITNMPGRCSGHSWSPDGMTIAFIGNSARAGEGWKFLERVWLVDSRGGRPRELTREIDNECYNVTLGDVATANFDVQPPIWSSDGSRLYFIVSEMGAARLYSRSIRKSDLRCELGGDVNIYRAQRTAVDGPIALAVGTATNPGDVHLFDPDQDAYARKPAAAPSTDWSLRTRLTSINDALLSRTDLAAPEPFQARSGATTVHGWVLKPPGFSKARKYPAILQIHGGPHAQYGCAFFHELHWMATRGYVVVFSNPRGSCGYGLKYRAAIRADWGNLDYKDCMAAADWMFSRPYVDKSRCGVTGGSYGGYMTNWIVAHTDRFKAAVTQRSVVNFESMFGTSDYGFDLGSELGGQPWNKLDLYRRLSPLAYVKNIRTPLLIEHEEQDHRCPIEQAEQLFTALKVLGRTVEFIRFEGESHGLCRMGRPQNRAERLRRIIGWFDRYLR